MKLSPAVFIFMNLMIIVHLELIFNSKGYHDGANIELVKNKQGAKSRGEDSFGSSKIFISVFDGASGTKFSSKHFSRLLANKFTEKAIEKASKKSLNFKTDKIFRKFILETLEKSDKEYQLLIEQLSPKNDETGTLIDDFGKIGETRTSSTLFTAHLEQNEEKINLRIAQKGDSSALVFRKKKVGEELNKFIYVPIFRTDRIENEEKNVSKVHSSNPQVLNFQTYLTEVFETDIVILASDGFYNNLNIGFLTIAINFLFRNIENNLKQNLESLRNFEKIYQKKTEEKLDILFEMNDILVNAIKDLKKRRDEVIAVDRQIFETNKNSQIKILEKKLQDEIKHEKEILEKQIPVFKKIQNLFVCYEQKIKVDSSKMPSFQELQTVKQSQFEYDFFKNNFPEIFPNPNAGSKTFYDFEKTSKYLNVDELLEYEAQRFSVKLKQNKFNSEKEGLLIRKAFEKVTKLIEKLDLMNKLSDSDQFESILECPVSEILHYPIQSGLASFNPIGECLTRKLTSLLSFEASEIILFKNEVSTKEFSNALANLAFDFSGFENYASPKFLRNVIKKSPDCRRAGKKDDIAVVASILSEDIIENSYYQTILAELDQDSKELISDLKADLSSYLSQPSSKTQLKI